MSAAAATAHVTPPGPILRAIPYREDRTTCLYFVQETTSGYIKIGISRDPRARLRLLRVDNPNELEVLGLFRVNRLAERDAHRMFEAHRVRGEWFRPAPEILAHIERLGSYQEFVW